MMVREWSEREMKKSRIWMSQRLLVERGISGDRVVTAQVVTEWW